MTSAKELSVKAKTLRVLTILFQQTRLLCEIASIDTEQETRLEALHYIQQCEDMIQDQIIEINVITVKLMSVIIIESKRIESISNILISPEWGRILQQIFYVFANDFVFMKREILFLKRHILANSLKELRNQYCRT